MLGTATTTATTTPWPPTGDGHGDSRDDDVAAHDGMSAAETRESRASAKDAGKSQPRRKRPKQVRSPHKG